MKILIVMPSGVLRGGAEEALVQFCRFARHENCEVTVALLQPGSLQQVIEETGVAVVVVDAGRLRQISQFLKTVGFLRKIIRRERPSVVLGWMTKAHIYGGPAAALERVPAVYFQHGLPDVGRIDLASRLIPALGALGCSRMVAQAQELVVAHRVLNVYEPVDVAQFAQGALPTRTECRQRLGLPAEGAIVGIVGRLQRWKGMHVFVAAMAELLGSFPECVGVIVGGVHHLEPDYAEELAALIRDQGLASRVLLVGWQTNVAEWMQAMDVLVHASEREPFGMVVVEAMALGKPVVATKPGGPEEVISDGVNGILVPWNDAPALAAAIRRFLDDPSFAGACGAAAVMRARDFSSEKYARRIRANLDQLLDPNSSENGKVRWLVVMPSGHGQGGAEEILTQFVRNSAAAGIDVYPVFLEPGKLAFETRKILPATKIIEAGRLRNPLAFAKTVRLLVREIRRVRPAIVLSWMTKAQIYAGVAARIAGVPAFYFQRGLPEGGAVDRLSRLPPARGILTCSHFVAAEQLRVTSVPIRAVCSSADVQRLHRAKATPVSTVRRSLGLADASPLVGIVGRLQHWKGMHVFAAAMALVTRELPTARGIIVGGQHEFERQYPGWLEDRIAELGVRDSVTLVGARENATEWMQAMDVVVHASKREPFGIVVIEAMTLGKPVVATIPGGPEEVITDGVNGLLVPWNDAAALAAAILRFLRDPEFSARCGLAATARARDFSSEHYAQKVRSAVEDILHERQN